MSEQTQIKKPKKSHSIIMKIILAVFVLIFIAIIGLNIFKNMMIDKFISSMPEKISPVTVITATSTEWTPVIKTTGLVRPNQGAMLSSQVSGTVSNVLVKAGQQVKKGDVLVELDNSVEKANLAATMAKLDSTRNTYQRYLKLYKTNSVSKQELDNAKASYDALEANIHALKASIERRKIVAPFDGVTGIVRVNVGQFINFGTEIVRVEDKSVMKVDFAIAQNELSLLSIGQKVTATADAHLGTTFSAKITAIEPAIEAATGLIKVQATFDEKESKKLLSGMFTRLRIALSTETNQIVIPQVGISYTMYGESAYILTALSDEDKTTLLDNEKFAYKDKMDKVYRAKQIPVVTKDRQGVLAQLKPGDIHIGDQVVVGGQQNISNGSLVIVSDKEAIGIQQPDTNSNL
ncbi:membrane fusion protein (multidrug efflux system) [Bisgaardia hudsonensis]|uniref:Membrane fusion protein (Multidrug efflux system) n=1 Tax=Bisgaardia hudsonensis TaxID=109472 RepID=A0A4R2MXU2_9PAST|nr:efflux RND transporter periplasmic adaptor subunit [Bisgaardia hudsonensis]QLB12290.1 efflux transporter periplasmic adaptor subunit [Bisgaardia hudsonensis]TCP12334.1 membrane fusion protein (multidrug efflux system) [Bisgaardia hudsonensis]